MDKSIMYNLNFLMGCYYLVHHTKQILILLYIVNIICTFHLNQVFAQAIFLNCSLVKELLQNLVNLLGTQS